MSMWNDALNIITAFASNDAWEISKALGTPAAWLIGTLVTALGAMAALILYKSVPFFDRHLERSVMVWSYLLIAAIIFVEVFRRFALNQQAPWSTTIPPFLFLVMTWFGCSYNVRLRTHLAFAEFRMNMSRKLQMGCLTLDAVLWFVFCVVVVVTSTRVAANSASNFQILLGTDDVLQWWFLATVPIAFVLMAGRVLENLRDDFTRYRNGDVMISQAVIGGETG